MSNTPAPTEGVEPAPDEQFDLTGHTFFNDTAEVHTKTDCWCFKRLSGVEPVSEVDTILEEWLDNAMSTSTLGWSPIDGYKGHYEGSKEAAGNDYERYKAEARAAIERLIAEARLDELTMARDQIPRFIPRPIGQLQGKTAYNEYIKKRLAELNQMKGKTV